jgi:hypothetical protein
MSQITANTVIKRVDDIVQAEIDGELVMMSIENGEYYGLDSVACDIWAHIEQPMSVEAICAEMLEKYDVSPEQCLNDVIVFVGQLKDSNIVTIDD